MNRETPKAANWQRDYFKGRTQAVGTPLLPVPVFQLPVVGLDRRTFGSTVPNLVHFRRAEGGKLERVPRGAQCLVIVTDEDAGNPRLSAGAVRPVNEILTQNMIRQVLLPKAVRNDKKDAAVENLLAAWWEQFQSAASSG